MTENSRKQNRQIKMELALLAEQGILKGEKLKRISEQYPVSGWDLVIIIRWFTILGAVSSGLGLFLIFKEHFSTFVLLETLFGISTAALFVLGRWLGKAKNMPRAGAASELLACFTLTGLSFTLGAHFSTGSGNWPALVGIDAIIFIVLAYLFNNGLMLVYACVNLFVWFGGHTGYISGWGAYWLGMNYPLRFLIAGAICTSIGIFHLKSMNKRITPFTGFGRVYIHFGLLVMNLCLWFFSLFGYFEKEIKWSGNDGERLLFSLLWVVLSALSLIFGLKKNNNIARSHGLVFLIINIYTFYFQFIIRNSANLWFIHMLVIGGSLMLLGFHIEKLRGRKRS